MRWTLRFRRLVVDDIDTAAEYYDLQSPGLGDRFRDEIARSLERIVENPHAYPRTEKLEVRKAVMNVFPYCVYYTVESNKVSVLAIHDARRDPSIWQRRK